MPKVSIYLPDALYEAVRKHEIAVSAVTQRALEEEVRRHANLDWIERVHRRPPRFGLEIDTSALLDDARGEFGA
jgi:post-segregation antitoxin (ccd killing protein)